MSLINYWFKDLFFLKLLWYVTGTILADYFGLFKLDVDQFSDRILVCWIENFTNLYKMVTTGTCFPTTV